MEAVWQARTLRFAPDTLFITIPAGAKVLRGCGRTRLTSRRLTNSFFPACPFGNWRLPTTDPNAQPCGLKYGFLEPVGAPGATTLQPFTGPPNPDSFTGGLLSQNRNFKQGMVQQFNLNIEHQFRATSLLTAGYAGTRSTHILFYGLEP